jgi:hypothetical protein
MIRGKFQQCAYILGTEYVWHTLDTCVWQSPFLLAGYQDLSIIYPELESFFVKRLKVRKVTPNMLIEEISRMVQEPKPNIDQIRQRLIEVGMILAKGTIDEAVQGALDKLAELSFLPLKRADGDSVLKSIGEEFAIMDHARYGNAFEGCDILLDFTVEEVQIMHVMFESMHLAGSYLSGMVTEESTVGDDAHQDNMLSQKLQAKAYALYW